MKRPRSLPIRLSEDEWQDLQRAARRVDRTVSGFIRAAALAAARATVRSHPAIAAERQRIRDTSTDEPTPE